MDGISWHTPDEDGNAKIVCRRLALPSFLWQFFNGAFGHLAEEDNWLQVGTMTPETVSQLFANAFDDMMECQMVGSILPFARETLPENVLLCDGSTHAKADYPLLYSVLDPSLIIDADNFAVPNLQGRFVLGEGGDHVFGDIGGEERHTLTPSEMPAHNHGYTHAEFAKPLAMAGSDVDGIDIVAASTNMAGGGQSHNNMPPYYVLVYGIVAK